MYSVTRFRNKRLAHVASRRPDIGAWHLLYTSALLWSQDSWSSFFIGTSYKDHQVKRGCVREKFTERSLDVWMFKFGIKKCYNCRTCSSEMKQIFETCFLFVLMCMWILAEYGPFRPKDLPLHIWRRLRVGNNDTSHIYRKLRLYTKNNIFPGASKIWRNPGNPKTTEILVFRISKKSMW